MQHQQDTHIHIVLVILCPLTAISTDDTVCLHVNVIYVIKGSPIVQHKRLATYFTKELYKRPSIMPNEATHSAWESCLWPCQVVSSYHRLTSLMTIASHANAPASPGSPVNAQQILFSVYLLQVGMWMHDAIKMKLCCIIWTSWTILPAAGQALDSSESREANLAAMKDDSRALSVIAMKWWFSKDQKKRLMDVCQRVVHKGEN